MKLLFRHSDHGACSVVVPTPTDNPANVHNQSDETAPSRVGAGSATPSPPSKRALRLERHESDCPVSNPDPHSRPRSRQFFRLGRNRSKGVEKPAADPAVSTDSSDDDEPNLSEVARLEVGLKPRSRGIARLRGPMRRRQLSLPFGGGSAANVAAEAVAEVAPEPEAEPPCSTGESTMISSLDDLDIPLKSANFRANDRLSQSERMPRAYGGQPNRRQVTFSSVSIREYSTILGDHPCCPSGPPLSLGWTLEREASMQLDKYEVERAPLRGRDIKLSGDARRDILRALVALPSTIEEGGVTEEGAAVEPTTAEQPSAMYSSTDLRRAERRLMRERYGDNRAYRRMNRSFFKPLTPEQTMISAPAPIVEDEASGMDTSPAKAIPLDGAESPSC